MHTPQTRSASSAKSAAIALIAVAALVAINVLAFAPAFNHGFVDYDDETNFVNNAALQGGVESLGWPWTATVLGVWQPTYWTFALLLAGGSAPSPQWFHAASVALHAVAAVVLCLICVNLLRRTRDVQSPGASPALWISAALAVAVYAVHPLRVETVAWASGQPYELALLFCFASVFCHLRAKPADGRFLPTWWVASVVLGGLAMLSKTAMVALPIVLLIIDAYPLRRLRPAADDRRPAAIVRAVAERVPLFLMAALAAWGAMRASRGMEQVTDTAARNAAQAIYSLAFPLLRTIAPVGLSPYYAKPADLNLASPAVLLSGLVLVAVTVAAVLLRKRAPGLAAAWAVYVVVLLPVVGVVQHGHQLTADRYANLATAGFVPLLAYALWRASRRAMLRHLRWMCAAVVVVLVLLSQRQARVWANSETLWTNVIAQFPQSAIAHKNYAQVCTKAGRPEAAERHLRKAVALDPSLAIAHYDLGVLCLDTGRADEAIAEFTRAIDLLPTFSSAYHNLGIALSSAGRPVDAVDVYRRGLERYSDHLPMLNNLGVLLQRMNRPAEAIAPLTRAAALAPKNAEIAFNLGNACWAAGDVQKATAAYRKAIALDPDYADAAINLSHIQMEQDEWPAARATLERALQRAPNNAAVATNLCWLLLHAKDARTRDPQRALAMAEALWKNAAARDESLRELYADALRAVGRPEDAAKIR